MQETDSDNLVENPRSVIFADEDMMDELTTDYLVELIHRDRRTPKYLIIPMLRDTLGVSDSKWAEFKNARIYSFKLSSTKSKGDRVQVEYGVKTSEGEWVDRKESHNESGRSELYKAMDDLIPFALSVIELSSEWSGDEVKLVGAVFKYGDDEADTLSVGLQLQGKTSLGEALNMPITPPRFERPPGDGDDETKCYDSDTARLVDRLINEIRRYLAGDRWS
jgi:hypothetical protein